MISKRKLRNLAGRGHSAMTSARAATLSYAASATRRNRNSCVPFYAASN